MTVNKYYVGMYEYGKASLTRSQVVIACSEEEAIEKTRHEPWWYEETRGSGAVLLKYPLTFKAIPLNLKFNT